jgi:hypothetical protein
MIYPILNSSRASHVPTGGLIPIADSFGLLNKFVDLSSIEDSAAMLAWDTFLGDIAYDDLYTDNFNDQTGVLSTTATYDGTNKLYSGAGFTLTTNSFEASTNSPVAAWMFLDIEYIDTITTNTDVKCYVSIDNGSTYNTLTLETTATRIVGSHNFFRADGTLSPIADKTIKFKVEMFNNKNMKLHGLAGGLIY